jgi:mono/diheme cytochrome c family protein
MRVFKNLQELNSLVKMAWLLIYLVLATSCALDMRNQPRVESFEKSAFFEDSLSARPAVPNTVARGQLQSNEHLYTGQINGAFARTFPFTVTLQVLERGQERYNIFCSPCHGLVGDGRGIITEYGLRAPNSFHTPELREQPPGYYFDLISRGTRVMPSYAARIRPEDRWAIVAYIRALQLSQNADLSQVPLQEIPNLE